MKWFDLLVALWAYMRSYVADPTINSRIAVFSSATLCNLQ